MFQKNKPFIIADIGSNWKRTKDERVNKQLCFQAIDAAKRSLASAAKFQLYTHKELYGFDGPNEFALPRDWVMELREYCDRLDIVFMCTSFSPDGLDFVNQYVDIHKLASSELPHIQMLERLRSYGKPYLVSTGGANQLEIERLFSKDRYYSEHLSLLECVGAYPAAVTDYRLYMLPKWQFQFDGMKVGVSDHTIEDTIAIQSCGFGATIFEKHFDPFLADPYPSTPDSSVSVGPEELVNYVKTVTSAFQILASQPKAPWRSEDDMLLKHRRRLMIIQNMRAGDILENNKNFGIFRSLEPDVRGAPAESLYVFDGKRVTRDLKQGEGLWIADIS